MADAASPRHRGWPIAVGATATAFAGLYGMLSVVKLARFHQLAFDLGIFDQGVWLLSQGRRPFVTVRGLNLFADHASFILYLVAIPYRLVPRVETLLWLTVVVLVASGPFTYLLARRLGAAPWAAGMAAVGVLLHPALAWNAWDTFHPEQLAIPLALLAAWLLAGDRPWWALAPVVAMLLVKEDAGLLVAPFGLVVGTWLLRRRAVGLVVAAAGVVGFLVDFLWVLPRLSPTGELLYSDRYAYLGDGPIRAAIGILTRPGAALSAIAEPRDLVYVAILVLSLPLVLLAPRVLLVAAPAVVANVLSLHTYQADVRYHYTVYPLAALAVAAAFGAARLSSWQRRLRPAVVVVALALAASQAAGPFPGGPAWPRPAPEQAYLAEAVALVPPDATVAAHYGAVPHLSRREVVYLFPNPWRRLDYGYPGGPMPDPQTVEWVVARRDVPVEAEVLDDLEASEEFTTLYDRYPVVVLRRR